MQTLIRLTLAVTLLAGSATALSQNQAAIELEAAIRTESIDGDLQAAIDQYRRLAESGDRAIAAEALLRMGGAYEKLGSLSARQAYQRVVEQFLDQSEQVRIARSRLAELPADPNGPADEPSLVAVLDEDLVSAADRYAYELSPDGSRVAFVGAWQDDPTRRGPLARNDMQNVDIFVADRSGTVIRPLLSDWGDLDKAFRAYTEGGRAFADVDNVRWSPDGRLIAFTARRPSSEALGRTEGPNDDEMPEITPTDYVHVAFVVDADGGSPEQIGPEMQPDLDVAPEVYYDLWWSNDSESLGFASADGIFMLSLDGEVSRIAEMEAGRNIEFGGYSPDGRWLAFTIGSEQLGNGLYVMPAAGGRAVRQARTFAEREGLRLGHRPAWAPDGRSIFAPSGVDGTTNIWRFSIDPETAQPLGDPVQVTAYVDAAITAPQAVRARGGLAYTLEQTRTTIHVADADRPDEFAAIARGNSPRLSTDGGTIYYVGQGSDEVGIFAIDRDGGRKRRLSDHRVELGPFGEGFELSPDGKLLLYRVNDDEDRHLFTVDTRTGELDRLFTFGADANAGVGYFSPDGATIAFTEDDGLYVMPADGGTPERIASLWEWYSSFIRWSPDGRWIAALGWESPEISENSVYLVSAAGGEPRRLRPLTGHQQAYLEGLDWHPDGQRLSYFDYEIVRTRFVDLDGNVSEPLFDHRDGWEYLGRWQADGRHYLFDSALEGNNWQNFVLDTDTGEIRPGVRSDDASASNTIPEFSRDQSTLVWTSRKQIRQLWLLDNLD